MHLVVLEDFQKYVFCYAPGGAERELLIMFKNRSSKKKFRTDKRGSMLTLVLVIVGMALIFITSAVIITNSTRARYYDNVQTGQARLTVTAVAETFCSALEMQDISDAELKSWAAGNATATISAGSVPGLKSSGETSTKVKFSKDSTYIYADFSTTIGSKADGTLAKENVRVYFKEKDPPDKATLFTNMIEVGDDAAFGGLHVGKDAPAGANNTVFLHQDAFLTETAGNNFYSDVICTGNTKFGNGGDFSGFLLFAGPSGKLTGMSGNIKGDYCYFINTSADAASTGGGSLGTVDWSMKNVAFVNYNVNLYFRTSDFYYDGGSNSLNVPDGGYATAMADTWGLKTSDTRGQDISNRISSVIWKKAEDAIKPENAFPTLATASNYFLANVDTTNANKARGVIAGTQTGMPLPSSGGDLLPGVYEIGTATANGTYNCDLSKGPYIFVVKNQLNIATGAKFKFTNGTDEDGNWGRFILCPNAKLMYETTSSDKGIESCTYNGSKRVKPHCYVYGYNGTEMFVGNESAVLEAYVGLFGDASKVTLAGKSDGYFGRITCTNFKTLNSNGSDWPYCPGPYDSVIDDSLKPATTNYDIVRFRYYYS